MGKINILDAASSNMIAAGEVVDRPSSALKELIENSIDASAKNVTVDLTSGGNARIRVTDDGEGILREDLPKTLYRHATSKIKTGYDIDGVATLGFRGEALAAAAAVSRMEIISKTAYEQSGSRLIADETGVELYETGCPNGTTVVINDLFYNVPARRKFMKKDSSEQAACLAVCEKMALSHPQVAFTVFCDGAQKMLTPGDGELYSALYAVYGAANAKTFLPLEYEQDGITVSGYVSKPESPRGTRGMQSFFVNGRYVKSRTVQAALEEAYRSYIPSGKFPAAVLMIALDRRNVDVNVHPAKTEIKFADERKLFSAVYYAVRAALSQSGEIKTQAPQRGGFKAEERDAGEKFMDLGVFAPQKTDPLPETAPTVLSDPVKREVFTADLADSELGAITRNNSTYVTVSTDEPIDRRQQLKMAEIPEFRIIGESYDTFIFAELADKILIVDKHAAHERLLYEQLRTGREVSPQTLLFPVTVSLAPAEMQTLLSNAPYLASFGFTVEEFGPHTVAVREIPSALKGIDGIAQILENFARDITEGGTVPFADKVDRALYTVACKAAVRAHDKTSYEENEYLIENVLREKLGYCPHGRPFIKEISKRELERYFDR